MEEKVILEKVRGGDTAAFALLYDRYWLKVYNFARLYITSSSEVSEVVQDVFVKVWESRDTFDETKNYTPINKAKIAYTKWTIFCFPSINKLRCIVGVVS